MDIRPGKDQFPYVNFCPTSDFTVMFPYLAILSLTSLLWFRNLIINSFRYTEKHILGSKGSDLSMCPLMKTV